MSLLSYRHPSKDSRKKRTLTDVECARLSKRAEVHRKKVPADLSLENIVKNRLAPPSSLNDLMDYYMYVERNAECLQFFIWYCDYVSRWAQLLPRQKALSPSVDPRRYHNPQFASKPSKPSVCQSRMGNIFAILEQHTTGNSGSIDQNAPVRTPAQVNFSWPVPFTSPYTPSGGEEEASRKWHAPFTIQPFRDEITRVARHYISTGASRQLPLTDQDRAACMHAMQNTTHPSALLPAFLAVEAALRGSHPNFIRFSICNANKPRLVFIRNWAIVQILVGLAFNAALVFSSRSRLYRLAAMPLFCMGITSLIALRHGICIILHWNYKRQPRPWEQFADDDEAPSPTSDGSPISPYSKDVGPPVLPKDGDIYRKASARYGKMHKHQRKNTNESVNTVSNLPVYTEQTVTIQTSGRTRDTALFSPEYPKYGHTTEITGGFGRTATTTVTITSPNYGNQIYGRPSPAMSTVPMSPMPNPKLSRKASSGSGRRLDPLRKPSLQIFGPPNEFAHEPWVALYERKGSFRKIFEPKDTFVTTQNEEIRAMQDRIVFSAVLWGSIFAVLLGAGCVFIPAAELF